MSPRIAAIVACLLLLAILSPGPILAQGGDTACPALVETALTAVEQACASLGRGEACYGHTRVDAAFWDETAELTFAAPADRVPLLDLRAVTTAPLDAVAGQWGLAVLSLQTSVAGALPGQAVTFLLMGDARIENAVAPQDAARPVEPVAAVVAAGSAINLRGGPATTARIVASAQPGDALSLVGASAARDWYEVALEAGRAWVSGPLIGANADALAGLPVTEGAAGYGPMQAFYFTSGLSAPACAEAPDALVIQNSTGTPVALRINGAQASIGSTVVLTQAQIESDSGPVTLLVFTLLEGELTLEINETTITLLQPDSAPAALPTLGVTVNAEGWIDSASRIVAPPVEAIGPAVAQSCAHTLAIDVLAAIPEAICQTPLAPAEAPAPGAASQSTATGLDGIGTGDPCTLAAGRNVNLRGGPGTAYVLTGQLAAGQRAYPDGYAQGMDGLNWWRVGADAWVRGDLVGLAGACGALAPVEQVPTPPPASAGGSSGGCTVLHDAPGRASFNMFACMFSGGIRLAANCEYLVRMSIGYHDGAEGEAEAQAAMPGVSLPTSMDGAPLAAVTGNVVEYNSGTNFWEVNQYYTTGILASGTYTIVGQSYSNGQYVDQATCVITAR